MLLSYENRADNKKLPPIHKCEHLTIAIGKPMFRVMCQRLGTRDETDELASACEVHEH